jgi:hypothetical protein
LDPATVNEKQIYGKTLRIMPYTPGFDPAWNKTAAVAPIAATNLFFAFNTMHHMPYVAGMFLGYRGGANYTLTPSHDAYGRQMSDIRVTRWTQAATDNAYRYISKWGNILGASNASSRASLVNRGRYSADGLAGMAILTTETNGSLSFQLPDYKQANFSLADPTKYVAGQETDGTNRQAAFATMTLDNPSGTNTFFVTMQTQVAAAPDWTCLFFLCCPTLDYQRDEPTPA